jgi:hypothetical protein
VRIRFLIALLTLCSSAIIVPTAIADTTQSSNWAGYAIHRDGTNFTRVLGEWRQPRATCAAHNPTYSAIWVGIGGFNVSSTALEQIGTELDCRNSGSVSSSAWYELVPAPSRTMHFSVRPGDLVSAKVTVTGSAVVLSLQNRTQHRTFSKTLHGRVDVSSAEWIVEAPSNCFDNGSCRTLPLANFGSTSFKSVSATSTAGHAGSILDGAWDTTQINLTPDGRQCGRHRDRLGAQRSRQRFQRDLPRHDRGQHPDGVQAQRASRRSPGASGPLLARSYRVPTWL